MHLTIYLPFPVLFVLSWEFRRPSGIISFPLETISFSFQVFWQHILFIFFLWKNVLIALSWIMLSLKLEFGLDILFAFIGRKMSHLFQFPSFLSHSVSLCAMYCFPFASVTICFLPDFKLLDCGVLSVAFFLVIFIAYFLFGIYLKSLLLRIWEIFSPDIFIFFFFFLSYPLFLSIHFHALLTIWCHLRCPLGSSYYCYLQYCFFLFLILDNFYCFYHYVHLLFLMLCAFGKSTQQIFNFRNSIPHFYGFHLVSFYYLYLTENMK